MSVLAGTVVDVPTFGLLLSGGGGVKYLVPLAWGVPKMLEDAA